MIARHALSILLPAALAVGCAASTQSESDRPDLAAAKADSFFAPTVIGTLGPNRSDLGQITDEASFSPGTLS